MKNFPIVYSYIMGANKNPDIARCGVPLKINSETIFFGPCMKRYREELYNKYLKKNKEEFKEIDDEIYFLGMNANFKDKSGKPIRKILWFGKLEKVLTFRCMYDLVQKKLNLSQGEKDSEQTNGYEKLYYKTNKNSPLHLKPIQDGYELCSDYHNNIENSWLNDIVNNDIVKNKDKKKIRIIDKKIILMVPSHRTEVFSRDCCLLFKNIFFAEGEGMIIDNQIINVFKERQVGRENEINSHFIFGKDKNDNPIGRQGYGLKFEGKIAKKLIGVITNRADEIKVMQKVALQEKNTESMKICKN